MYDTPLKEIMTREIITVNKYQSLVAIADIFKSNTFHHVPVVDNENELVGIISVTDFERVKNGASLFKNPKLQEYNDALFQTLLIQDVMTRNVISLDANESIYKAYAIFKQHKFRAIPILDAGVLVGIISPMDLLDYFFNK